MKPDMLKFFETLQALMCQINPGVAQLEPYEFRYCLANITPTEGWQAVPLQSPETIEAQITDLAFYKSIQFKPLKDGKIVLDEQIVSLTQMLLAGLVQSAYTPAWICQNFFFDIRAFVFLTQTPYYNPTIRAHFGGEPFMQFEPFQKQLAMRQELGYREFSQANQAVDNALLQIIENLIKYEGTPQVITLVGPTGAGKTEIIHKMCTSLANEGYSITSIEMDNFYKDGSFREGKPLDKNLIYYDQFIQCMQDVRAGRQALIPRYDFLTTTSSHDLEGNLRPGREMLTIQPADVIFLEGNYPFHQPDVSPLVGFKIVYLTADDVRLKRKWRRDIDLRKKYDLVYFVNRYFRTQAIRAAEVYRPLMAVCDMVVDTTAASVWMTPQAAQFSPVKKDDRMRGRRD